MKRNRGWFPPGSRVKTDFWIIVISATTESKKHHHHKLQTVTSTESTVSSLSTLTGPTSAFSTGTLFP